MEKAYLVVRADNLDYSGSAIASMLLSGKDLKKTIKKLKEAFPNLSWDEVSISDIYLHKEWIQENTQIILTQKTAPYLSTLKEEFPLADVVTTQELLQS